MSSSIPSLTVLPGIGAPSLGLSPRATARYPSFVPLGIVTCASCTAPLMRPRFCRSCRASVCSACCTHCNVCLRVTCMACIRIDIIGNDGVRCPACAHVSEKVANTRKLSSAIDSMPINDSFDRVILPKLPEHPPVNITNPASVVNMTMKTVKRPKKPRTTLLGRYDSF